MRNRVQGLRYVKGSDLAADPRNWRQHPPAQRQALQAMIDRVGLVDAVIAREAPDGSLVLVDGHLRADLDPEVELPVLVVDLTEEEAGEVLASFDPLSAMAQADVDTIPPLGDGPRHGIGDFKALVDAGGKDGAPAVGVEVRQGRNSLPRTSVSNMTARPEGIVHRRHTSQWRKSRLPGSRA